MGLFSKNNDCNAAEDLSYILGVADIITQNDKKIMKTLKQCTDNPRKYADKENKLFTKKLIASLEMSPKDIEKVCFANDATSREICVTALIDELLYNDYVLTVGIDEKLDEFLEMLVDTKNYFLIRDAAESTQLNPKDNAVRWCHQLNSVLDGRAFICEIKGTDEDEINIFFANYETYEKLSSIAALPNGLISVL